MCRQNLLWGLALLTFGVGVLVGLWLKEGFFAHCFGFGLMITGWCILRRK